MVQFRKDFDIIPQILSHKVLTCQTIPKLRSEALQGWKRRWKLSHQFDLFYKSDFAIWIDFPSNTLASFFW